MTARFVRIVLPCLLVFGATIPAQAQVGKSPQVRAAFGDVCASAAKSIVRVYSGGKEVALGLVVDADGWVLTKHSVLKGKLTCKLPGGKDADAELKAHDVPHDLALIKVDATELVPAEFCDSKICKVGHWVCSPDVSKNTFVAIGVVSVASREIKNAGKQLSGPPKAWLGVAFDTDYAGVKIQETVKDSPAQKAGIKAGDIILKVNGEHFQSPDEFAGFVGKFPPGTTLELKLEREEKEIDMKVTLAPRPADSKRGDQQNNMGSKLSDRRGGFPNILTHDSVIRPEDCGGPLVNIDGKVVGINISRAGRTESYAIPAEIVQTVVAKLKKEAQKQAK